MKIDRKLIFDKYNGHCAYCGCELKNGFQVDHLNCQSNFDYLLRNKKIPEHIKKLNCIENLMPSCGSCNNYKSVHSLEQFRNELMHMRKRLNERSTHYKISKRFGLIQEVDKPIIFYFETQTI